jgi:pimeloyl-ACP methyl ester carboxylesterase
MLHLHLPPEATADTARQISGGSFIAMEDIGHFPMSENYPVFKTYLLQALDRIDRQLR